MRSSRQQFVISLFNVRNRVRFAMDDAFRPMGITDATWRTLFYLEQTGDGVFQKDLATVMGIEGPSLVRLLDSLEDKQLIERRPGQTDRRSKSVHLTRKALKLLDKLHDVADQVRGELLEDISDEEIEHCLLVFQRIMDTKDHKVAP
ncbi:MAG: MarR family transcriptional regulator [Pseudomonadales bacterium]